MVHNGPEHPRLGGIFNSERSWLSSPMGMNFSIFHLVIAIPLGLVLALWIPWIGFFVSYCILLVTSLRFTLEVLSMEVALMEKKDTL